MGLAPSAREEVPEGQIIQHPLFFSVPPRTSSPPCALRPHSLRWSLSIRVALSSPHSRPTQRLT